MPERIREVRVFEHVYVCDTPLCQGTLVPSGKPGMVQGTIQYICPICRDTKSFSKQFPRMISVPADAPIPAGFQKEIDTVNGVVSTVAKPN